MGGGAGRAAVHGVTKEPDTAERLSTQATGAEPPGCLVLLRPSHRLPPQGFACALFSTRNALPFISTRPHFFLSLFISLPKHLLIRDTLRTSSYKADPFPHAGHALSCSHCSIFLLPIPTVLFFVY